MQLNVNTDAVVAFTNKLEKLHRAAFPVAVRTALNSAAFDMKKSSIQQSADDEFTIRNKTFFKATSKVNKATGFDVDNMQSIVGFTKNSLAAQKKGYDQAIDDLEQQESGGKIKGRSLIPTLSARIGASKNKSIRPNARLKELDGKIVDASKASGKNDKQKFVKSVFYAGVGGHVLSEINGKGYVWRVNSLKRTDGGNFKLTPLYTYKKGRSVNVKATHFMAKATEMTTKKIEDFYIKAAEVQFKRTLQ